jgi:hypothetical protein
MKEAESVNESVKAPVASAVTLSLQLQVFPTLSFTDSATASPGCQPAPVRVTVAPGG